MAGTLTGPWRLPLRYGGRRFAPRDGLSYQQKKEYRQFYYPILICGQCCTRAMSYHNTKLGRKEGKQ